MRPRPNWPAAASRQFHGNHAVLNYFVLGDEVVMTPYFAGGDLVSATSGKYKGLAVLQEEQRRGFELLWHLDDAQHDNAVISRSKGRKNNLAEAFKDNLILDYAGIPAATLRDSQQKRLLELMHSQPGDPHRVRPPVPRPIALPGRSGGQSQPPTYPRCSADSQ